jgi:hypothetical protein
MTLVDAAALWALGELGSEQLPNVAATALERGFDSAALRQLAGELDATTATCEPLFRRALAELSIPFPDRRAAQIGVALYHARRIVDGTVSPYQGARAIWRGAAIDAQVDHSPNWHILVPFVGLASEYEDDPDNREAYAKDIMEAARTLLRNSWGRLTTG